MTQLMACGHAANGFHDGRPVCVICFGVDPGATVASPIQPHYEGRSARCRSCGTETPSRSDLPFFEYRGPGSPRAHEKGGAFPDDRYYCGCRGWD